LRAAATTILHDIMRHATLARSLKVPPSGRHSGAPSWGPEDPGGARTAPV